mmetsp:Transcript_107104/g.302782  ORF Transcript_107104/g.302782 Transcript_107104/m.302782 type:complete len:265 (+) Transcript_107104:1079-1873(+)
MAEEHRRVHRGRARQPRAKPQAVGLELRPRVGPGEPEERHVADLVAEDEVPHVRDPAGRGVDGEIEGSRAQAGLRVLSVVLHEAVPVLVVRPPLGGGAHDPEVVVPGDRQEGLRPRPRREAGEEVLGDGPPHLVEVVADDPPIVDLRGADQRVYDRPQPLVDAEPLLEGADHVPAVHARVGEEDAPGPGPLAGEPHRDLVAADEERRGPAGGHVLDAGMQVQVAPAGRHVRERGAVLEEALEVVRPVVDHGDADLAVPAHAHGL